MTDVVNIDKKFTSNPSQQPKVPPSFLLPQEPSGQSILDKQILQKQQNIKSNFWMEYRFKIVLIIAGLIVTISLCHLVSFTKKHDPSHSMPPVKPGGETLLNKY